MTVIRVGIVGCGRVTQISHLPSLYQLNHVFHVTALCDVSMFVLEGVANAWGVPGRFRHYSELIEDGEVDAVLVANSDAYHSEVTLAAIAAGKHVLVEKPMCITLREADEIIAASHRSPHIVVQVGYMRRYEPAFVDACRLVRELEEIHLAHVHDVIGRNSLVISGTSRVVSREDITAGMIAAHQHLKDERLTEAIGEGNPELRSAYKLMLGLSSHDISAMRELLGMPRGVIYAAQRQGGSYLSAAFDYGTYVCQFETGIDHIPRFDASLEVYGRERVLRVQYDTPFVRNLPVRLWITEANGGGVVERAEHPAWGDAFVAEWRAFHENIAKRRVPKTSPADFRQDLELFRDMIAMMRS